MADQREDAVLRSSGDPVSAANMPADHEHDWRFLRTVEDWWDGDEEDIYGCAVEGCTARKTRYVCR